MLKNFILILRYDIQATLRQAFSWLTPLLFFVIVVSLFPLTLGTGEKLLNNIAPGIIWITALLATLMSIDQLFRDDLTDGFLDQYLLSTYPLTLLVCCKMLSYWLTHCLPLIIISPVLGLLLHLNTTEEITLVITLLLGTPTLILLGSIGAALIPGIRGHGLLLPILILPLYIPVLIFGASTLIAAQQGLALNGYFAILGALALLSLVFAPLLASAGLRIGVNQ
jgi:heme exporter protein B